MQSDTFNYSQHLTGKLGEMKAGELDNSSDTKTPWYMIGSSGQAVQEPSTPNMLELLRGPPRVLAERPPLSLFQPPREAPAPSSPTAAAESPLKRPRRSSALRPMNYAFQDGSEDTTGDPEFSPRGAGGGPSVHRKAATDRRQAAGSRGGPSKFRGVVWHKSNCKWEARIYEGGKQKFLGYYISEEAAAHAYDDYAIRLHGNLQKLNFPELYADAAATSSVEPDTPALRSTWQARGSPEAGFPSPRPHFQPPRQAPTQRTSSPRGPRPRVQPVKGTSRFRGVSWNSNCAKWRAQVWKASEVHHLGYFEGEEDAARAYDEAVLRIRGPDAPTNFPRSDYLKTSSYTQPEPGAVPSARISSFRGVSWSERHGAWVAELWDGERFRLLGVFGSEVAAARKYDVACLELNGVEALTNFPVASYEAELAALTLRDLASADLSDDEMSLEEEEEHSDDGQEHSSSAAPRPNNVALWDPHARQWVQNLAYRSSPILESRDGRADQHCSSNNNKGKVVVEPASSDDSSASTAPNQHVAMPLLSSPDALGKVLSALASVQGSHAGVQLNPAAAWAAAMAQGRMNVPPYAS